MKSKGHLAHKVGKSMKRASPTILTCIGAVGMVATVVLAVRATPKALRLIEAAEDRRDDPNLTQESLTKTEIIKTTWKCYIPATVTGTATLVCIFGANILNRRQQASLVSAYALVSRSYNDYKRKVKEICGEDAHKQVMASLVAEKSTKPPLYAGTLGKMTSLGFDEAHEEELLFYDAISERYFQATISQVLQAEYHLNRNFALGGGFTSLNQFYDFLGIDKVPGGDEIGWMVSDGLYWVDFDHVKTIVDDGLNGEVECYIIDAPFPPMKEEDYDEYL